MSQTGSSTLERWRRVEDLFHRLLELPAEERLGRLAEWSGGDEALREEVASLLAAEVEEGAAGSGAGSGEDRWIGSQLGAFRVERMVGRGGMGAVYLCERTDGVFAQKAAAKIVFTRLTSAWLRDRFVLERQMLASLHHPNIAALIGGGVTDDGEPYLIMEYIEGRRLDVYCEETGAVPEGIVGLMLQLCGAVSYAHRNLIVHRDLKPGNVLVTADGTVKLLDFGTAKLTGGNGAQLAEGTRLGMHAFTPDYASPEQLFGEPVSTASDIYSLGVVLYRLLTGHLPFDVSVLAGGQAGLVRALYDTEPATPSQSITRVVAPDGDASRTRRTWEGTVRGDLDAIVLKALRPVPAHRYATVEELAADLERFLEHRPVLARQGSVKYLAMKWLRRNAFAASAAAAIAIALAGGVWQAVRQGNIAREEERRARQGYGEVRRMARLLLTDFYDEVKQVPGSADVQRKLVTQAQGFLDRLSKESTGGDPETLLDLVDAYRKNADLLGNPYEENLGDATGALATYGKGMKIAERLLARQPVPPRAVQAVAFLQRGMAETLFSLGRVQESIPLSRQAAERLEALARLPGAEAGLISDAAGTYDSLGDQYGLRGIASLGNPKEAEACYRRAIEIQGLARRKDPQAIRPRRGMVIGAMKIANLYSDSDPGRAARELTAALAEWDAIPEAESKKTANQRLGAMLRTRLGAVLEGNGQQPAAEPYLEKAREINQSVLLLDQEDQRARYDLVIVLNFLASAQRAQGKPAQSLVSADQMIEHLTIMLKKSPENLVWRGHLAAALRARASSLEALGRGAEAASVTAKALELTLVVVADPKATPNDLNRAVQLLLEIRPERLRDPVKALALADRAVKISGGSSASSLWLRGRALTANGRTAEARAVLENALAMLPAPDPAAGVTSTLRTNIVSALGEMKEAGR